MTHTCEQQHDYPCRENGHFDCAVIEGGACHAERHAREAAAENEPRHIERDREGLAVRYCTSETCNDERCPNFRAKFLELTDVELRTMTDRAYRRSVSEWRDYRAFDAIGHPHDGRGDVAPVRAMLRASAESSSDLWGQFAAELRRRDALRVCATCGEREATNPTFAGTHRYGPVDHPFTEEGKR